MEFSRQEYWSGLSFPSPGDLPDPGIEPASTILAGRFFTAEPPEKPIHTHINTHTHTQIYLFNEWAGGNGAKLFTLPLDYNPGKI